MEWIFLAVAIVLELVGTTLMKMSDGLTKLLPSAGMFIAYILCFGSLALALKKIPVSAAYAIWSGVGIVAIAVIGVLFFKEKCQRNKSSIYTSHCSRGCRPELRWCCSLISQ